MAVTSAFFSRWAGWCTSSGVCAELPPWLLMETRPTSVGPLQCNCLPLTHSLGTSLWKFQKVLANQLSRLYKWRRHSPLLSFQKARARARTHTEQSQSMPLVLHWGRFFINTPLSDFRLSPLIFLYAQNLAGKAGWGLSPMYTHPSPKRYSLKWVFISFPLNSRRYPASLAMPPLPETDSNVRSSLLWCKPTTHAGGVGRSSQTTLSAWPSHSTKLMPAAHYRLHSLGLWNRLLTRITNLHHQLPDDSRGEAFGATKQKTTSFPNIIATVSHGEGWRWGWGGVPISEASKCLLDKRRMNSDIL